MPNFRVMGLNFPGARYVGRQEEQPAHLTPLQRQLLCIARVLLEKRKIVILDEASSR